MKQKFANALLAMLMTGCASAMEQDVRLCIRGESFESGKEFLQTRQLRLTLDGPPAGDLLLSLAGKAVRDKIWPHLLPEQVVAQAFDEAVCGNEPAAEASIAYSADDLAAMGIERGRGPGESPRTTAVVEKAQARPAPAKQAPAGTPPEARRHDWFELYFATTRNATGQSVPARAFGSDRVDDVRVGTVQVSIPFDHRWANLESPSIRRLEWDVDPARHIALASEYRPMQLSEWKAELALKARALKGRGVLLFIHGYNSSFEDAAKRAAQLAHDLTFPGPTVLFSWPSDGTTKNYIRDEQEARNAYRQMARVLDDLTRSDGASQNLVVIAHSMGNRVFTEGLAELLRQRPGAESAFRRVVLAAPDVSVEEFRQRWLIDLASPMQSRFTLYASDQDVPVSLSAQAHGGSRLGSGGPDIAVFPPMASIDASKVTREWFGLNHSYFAENDTIMGDLFLLVHQGAAPRQRPRLRQVTGRNGTYWEFRQ